MCLIVTQTRAQNPVNMTEEEVRKAFANNSDGAGIMFDWNGELIIEKPFMSATDLWDAYQVAVGEYDTHLGVHWRHATSGGNDFTNTHPHIICRGKAAFMHNGVLPHEGWTGFDISDSVYWARTVFYGRSPNHVMGQRFRKHVQQYIGTNKLAIISKDGRLSILNEEKGEWKHNRWHSNTSLWSGTMGGCRPGTKYPIYDDDEWDPIPYCKAKKSTSSVIDKGKKTTTITGSDGTVTKVITPWPDKGKPAKVTTYREDPRDTANTTAKIPEDKFYKWPFSMAADEEWLEKHFDHDGCLIDEEGDVVLCSYNRPCWASDLVNMCAGDHDTDIHEYAGLIIYAEKTSIEKLAEAGRSAV